VTNRTDELAALWTWFAEAQCHGYSPLYERICLAVADEPWVLDLVCESPPAAHLPPNLLGAVHYLLLDGLEHPLADVYAGRSEADPVPLFLDVCRAERSAILDLMATRRVQTNDCGRSALIGPALTWVAGQFRVPLALVDVGTSAGLNLVCDRYRMDYGEAGVTGPVDSPVQIRCDVIGGTPPIADHLPSLVARTGIDHTPIDVRDPDDARWLLACVWPDTGRLERTAASIALAQADPPTLVAGDAVETLPGVLAGVPASAVAVVTTTWFFSYLSVEDRSRFAAHLAERSTVGPVVWVLGDAGPVVDEQVDQAMRPDDDPGVHVLGAVLFESGARRSVPLAAVQQHGGWIDWRAD
jgi:hypothetical protein